MLTRRFVIGACALSLAIPAAAGASESTNAPGGTAPSTVAPKGPYGNAAAGTLGTVMAKGPYGNAAAGTPGTAKPRGPYGIPPAGPPSTVKARGPYGIPAPAGSPSTTAALAHASSIPLRDETNGWRTAAIFEAALLAALLLGWARLLPARHRAGHMAT
jgi:hypothetical protein